MRMVVQEQDPYGLFFLFNLLLGFLFLLGHEGWMERPATAAQLRLLDAKSTLCVYCSSAGFFFAALTAFANSGNLLNTATLRSHCLLSTAG
jgi:hypothetical protein